MPQIHYSPQKSIPYREGDIVRAVITRARIEKITDSDVYYSFLDHGKDDAPHHVPRETFEGNLDRGVYRTILSGDAELYIGPKAESPKRVDPAFVSDDEIRAGYERILTGTDMYPEELYTTIRDRFLADDSLADKASSLMAIYEKYGDAELEDEGKAYLSALRGGDGIAFYIGQHGDTLLSWTEIATIIDEKIGDGSYPFPLAEQGDTLADRIGTYNIPDEIDEMSDSSSSQSDLDHPSEAELSVEAEQIRVLVVPPQEPPYVTNIEKGYKALRRLVDPSGYSAYTRYEFHESIDAVCADEVSDDEPVNRILPGGTPIRGTFAVARVNEKGAYVSLNDEDVERYKRLFSSTVIDLSSVIQERKEQQKKAEERLELEQREREGGLEAALYPFRRAKGQPDPSTIVEPELDYDPEDFTEIVDIPSADEIEAFVPIPKVVDFSSLGDGGQNEPSQISFYEGGGSPGYTPDASFEADREQDAFDELPEADDAKTGSLSHGRVERPRINYHYSEDDRLNASGPKAKYQNNIEAIKLLKKIESESRAATADEQKILARYVGWGGLSGAFDPKKEDWTKEYAELTLLLGEGEYHNARESILTAYYTPPELVRHIYTALERFGFTDGKNRNILDPAYGTGNFSSVIPDQLQNANFTGVEIDSISARIAQQLYQRNKVIHSGFETSGITDGSFDVIIGNVPFNEIKVYEKQYGDSFYIHDYFFVKSLDALKPGGIAALITSRGTMDKMEHSARMEMARRADLIGAVRLPNHTFQALAGTKVTTDIIFLKKLPEMRSFRDVAQAPAWVDTRYSASHDLTMNSYFVEHPDMLLGDMRMVSGRFGPHPECVARENQDTYALLEQAVGKLEAVFSAAPDEAPKPQVRQIHGEERETISAPDGVKTYTYHIMDGALYYCTDGELIPQDFSGKRLERVTGLCGIRDALREVIDMQSAEQYNPAKLADMQKVLNTRYDAFIKRHGPINGRGNINAFSDDDTFPLLRSIEIYDKEQDTWNKAPIFFRATIRHQRFPDKAETALQALQISLNLKQRVDIPFMAQLYRKHPDIVIAELGDKIYLNPQKYVGLPHEGWELDEEYLSGYVRDKLAYATLKAEEHPDLFSRNVEALQAVQPAPLLPGDIEYNIGSPWIPVSCYREFMYETFDTYGRNRGNSRHDINVEYMEYTNEWYISNKSSESDSIKVNQTFGSGRMNAYEIFEASLNLQSVTVRDRVDYRDENGKEKTKYVINTRETMIARSKQQQIRDAFKSWLFADKNRAEPLLTLYNERFNNIVPRTYDGSHLVFPGISDVEQLRPHQLNVAARIIYNGSALMAHEVGAGKTAAMIAAGMYMKHYGMISKPVYVVPNHIVQQWTNEFLRFFPGASLLVTTGKDFEKKNRQHFVGKIAMGEYDGVIISHSQFEKIMVSPERQERLLTAQINQLTHAIDKMKAENGQSWSIKQIMIFRKKLETRLERLVNADKKDDLIHFEELGLDFMFVDEAHMFKNNFTYTKIRNVAGISNASSQRAADMKLKCEYLQETYNGRGVTFATGTPISNSMAELFIMQMYLQPHELRRRGVDFFDNWAATFAQIVASLEITPEGGGYRMRSRFAKFHNLPELMNIFWQVADIQTEEMLKLPTPEIEGGKAQTVQTECSDFQKEIIKSFVTRAEAIRAGDVKPEEDNMLKLTHEAKLLSIDPRLLYPDAPNDPDSKLNTCIRNLYDIWRETSDDRLTQILFCDSGTPKPNQFNVYDETKSELIRMGVPEHEIAFIHDCKTDVQREKLFEKVRAGDVRILLGSTQKLGMGTNVQDKLCAIHHLDCPWRPTDITQRNGRGKRYGNKNAVIRIFQYVTKGTFDSYLWQIQEQKLRYTSQVMTHKAITRSCEDVDITVLNAAEVKAIATDNPLLLEKMTTENEVTRLSILRSAWQNEQATLERRIDSVYPKQIENCEKRIGELEQDIAIVRSNTRNAFLMELDGRKYDDRVRAGKILMMHVNLFQKDINAVKSDSVQEKRIGSLRGMDVYITALPQETYISVKGIGVHFVSIGTSEIGIITRLENVLDGLDGKRKEWEQKKTETAMQLENAKNEAGLPFQYEDELNGHSKRLIEINTKLEFKELADQDMVLDDENSVTDVEAFAMVAEPAPVR